MYHSLLLFYLLSLFLLIIPFERKYVKNIILFSFRRIVDREIIIEPVLLIIKDKKPTYLKQNKKRRKKTQTETLSRQ